MKNFLCKLQFLEEVWWCKISAVQTLKSFCIFNLIAPLRHHTQLWKAAETYTRCCTLLHKSKHAAKLSSDRTSRRHSVSGPTIGQWQSMMHRSVLWHSWLHSVHSAHGRFLLLQYTGIINTFKFGGNYFLQYWFLTTNYIQTKWFPSPPNIFCIAQKWI